MTKPRLGIGHGIIGFSYPWPEAQGVRREELLVNIAEACFGKVDYYALVSESYGNEKGFIERGSLDDRLGFLALQAQRLPNGYSHEVLESKEIGLVALTIRRDNKKVTLVNAQAVVASKNPDCIGPENYDEKDRVKLLVIGTNQIKNKQSVTRAAMEAYEANLIPAIENYGSSHFGMDEDTAMRILGEVSFIEFDPSAPKDERKKTLALAREMRKPVIFGDNSHYLGRIGEAGIGLNPDSRLSCNDANTFLSGLWAGIYRSRFEDNFGSGEGLINRLRWGSVFALGLKFPSMAAKIGRFISP